ncbi:MAG: YihY/virulence factor BrkB family protein [Rikenellaceae bacterium]|nr:YihY/virulence factor BrkB family protein [Rikenellaceae bacterium]MBR2333350.1 YihY/virulence factor BrkB family protein [Rikenellaceae bacterium]
MLKGIFQYLRRKPNEAVGLDALRLPRGIKLILYTIMGVDRHQTLVRSAALAFYTVMSLVPILALVFAVFKGFGLEEGFTEEIYKQLPDYRELLEHLFGFAENMLARTRGGVVAAGGIVFLIWSVYQVFGGVETAFNAIWEVKRKRSLARTITDYIAIVFIVPVLLVLVSGIMGEAKNWLSEQTSPLVADLVYWPLAIAGVWLGFTILYHQLPNTRVRFRAAALAALLASVVFLAWQSGYFYIQKTLNTYNAIYGTFAAIPLMLVFVQSSWMFILLGGELSYAIQNVQNFERDEEIQHIGVNTRKRIAVAIMAVIAKRYTSEPAGPSSAEEVANSLELPNRIATEMIFELESAGLLIAAVGDNENTEYLPARDVHTLTIADVLHSLDYTEKTPISLEHNELLKNIGDRFERLEGLVAGSAINTPITELL